MLNRNISPTMLHYAYISKVIILYTCCIVQLFRCPDLNVTVYLYTFMENFSCESFFSYYFALNRSCRTNNCVLIFCNKSYCRTRVIINSFFLIQVSTVSSLTFRHRASCI